MKKPALPLLLSVCFFLVSACSSGWDSAALRPAQELRPPEDVAMTLDTSVEEQITVFITNTSDTAFRFGEYCDLHVLLDGSWYEVSSYPYFVEDIAYELMPGTSISHTYSTERFGTLYPGTYRFVVEEIWAEFEVSK